MVSDAGYGLLMAIVAGIMIKKYKLEGIAEKLIKLIFFGGISTFIWGAIFGGWFGDIIQLVTGNPNAVKPLVFNPLDDVMRLLIWSFVLEEFIYMRNGYSSICSYQRRQIFRCTF